MEKLHQSLHAQVRTLRHHVHEKYVFFTLLSINHLVFPWLVRHSPWLLVNRCLIHAYGFPSYSRRCGRNFESAVCKFAEIVHFRDTGEHITKLISTWDLDSGLDEIA